MTAAATTKAVNLRVRDDIRALIDRAARSHGKSRSDFMIDAARRAAEEALLDECLVRVGKKPAAAADKAAHEAYVKRVSELRDFFNTFDRLFGGLLGNHPGSLAKAVKVLSKIL